MSCIEKLTRKDFDARPVKRDVTLRLDELANIWRALHDPERCKSDPVPDFGFEPFIGHKIANHVLPGVLAHYNHNSYEMQREQALKTWADRIEALANSKNVVQLRRTA